MKIIETKKSFEEFVELFSNHSSIVIPIFTDIHKHPSKNELCLIYFDINDSQYILPFNHSECLNLSIDYIKNLKSKHEKYVYDKKRFLYLFDWDNVIDLNLNYYLLNNRPLHIEDVTTNAHTFYQTKYFNNEDVNKIIPVTKHSEYCDKLVTLFKQKHNIISQSVNMSYNDEVIKNLHHIESNGLKTIGKNLHGFISDGEDMIFSEYNLFTTTGRPSNRFGGVNFAALNKSDGSRKHFISRFEDGVLLEFDFDAYHLRLIADRIGYKFPNGSVHSHMAELYNVDYDEAKALSFKYLYGFIPPEIAQMNKYFSRVHDYIEKIWIKYNNDDFLESDIYNRRISKNNLSNMNKNKLFNYYIQLLETETNMKVLSSLVPAMKNYKSKLVLYSYDSFLLDFCIKDGLNSIKEIKDIIEQNGRYPTKVSWGKDYDSMVDITEKFME
jgi:hypothetical protein|tara:strand:- start:4365 stop:5684 length:1320 start_codon:yes stop_codon:yes gene_type:complete